MSRTRTETDSLGEIEVPADRRDGAQTARSLVHFSIGTEARERMPIEVIHALALLKEGVAEDLERSLMLVAASSPRIGDDEAAKPAEAAQKENLTLREANRKLKVMDEAEFDRLTDPKATTRA